MSTPSSSSSTLPQGLLGLQYFGQEISGQQEKMSTLRGFSEALAAARNIVVLTGAGISAESAIPTFRGAGGLWRTYAAQELATPYAFSKQPSLVWEFYHYRREVVSRCQPNLGHFAVTALQQKMEAQGKKLSIITQNIDRLHQASGSKNVLELHGSLWLLKPIDHEGFLEEEGKVWEDRRVPLAPCFVGKCQPDPAIKTSDIPVSELPHKDGKLLRPSVVWFGEGLDERVLENAYSLLEECDMLLVIGTSSVVYPAAGFADFVANRRRFGDRGKRACVVEVNLEATDNSGICHYAIQGKAGEVLPSLFEVEKEIAALQKDKS